MKVVILGHDAWVSADQACQPSGDHSLPDGQTPLQRMVRQFCLGGADQVLVCSDLELSLDGFRPGQVKQVAAEDLAEAVADEPVLVVSDHLLLTPKSLELLLAAPEQDQVAVIGQVRDAATDIRLRAAEPRLPHPTGLNALGRGGALVQLVGEESTVGTVTMAPAVVLQPATAQQWFAALDLTQPGGALTALSGLLPDHRIGLLPLAPTTAGVLRCSQEQPISQVELSQQTVAVGWRAKLSLGPALQGAGVQRLLVLTDDPVLPPSVASYLNSLGVEHSHEVVSDPVPEWQQVRDQVTEQIGRGADAVLAIGPRSANLGKWISALGHADLPQTPFDLPAGRRLPLFSLVVASDVVSAAHDGALVLLDGQLVQVQHPRLLPDFYCVDTSLLETLDRAVRAELVATVLGACLLVPLLNPDSEAGLLALSRGKDAIDGLHGWLRADPVADELVIGAAQAAGQAVMAVAPCPVPLLAWHRAQASTEAVGFALLRSLPGHLKTLEHEVAEADDRDQATQLRFLLDRVCAALRAEDVAHAATAITNLIQLLDGERVVEPWASPARVTLTGNGASVTVPLAQNLAELVQASPTGAPNLALPQVPAGPEPELEPHLPQRQLDSFRTLQQLAEMATKRRLNYYLFDDTLSDALLLGRLNPWTETITVAMPRSSYGKLVRWRDQLPAELELVEGPLGTGGRGSSEAFIGRRANPEAGVRVRVLEEIKRGAAPRGRVDRLRMRTLHAIALAQTPSGQRPGRLEKLVRPVVAAIPESAQVVPRKVLSRGLNQGSKLASYHLPGANSAFYKSMFSASWFGKGTTASLFGHRFPVPKRGESVLARLRGASWATLSDGAIRKAPQIEWRPLTEATPPAKPLVSIVVPVYGVEDYIDQCMDSLVHQDDDHYEVIAVDDGSPDDSISHLLRYEQAYPGIVRVLRKPNGGLSDARNYGLERANGEYVAFVDSDDVVDTSLVRLLRDKAVQTDADIVVCNLAELRDNGTTVRYRWMSNKNSFGRSIHESPELLISSHPFAWNKLYRRSLFMDSGIRYPKGQAFEDSATTFNLMLLANKIEYVDKALYFYRLDRADSITNTFDQKFYDIFKSFDSIRGFYGERGELDRFSNEINEIIRRTSFARVAALEGVQDREGAETFVDAVYDYLEQHVPNWSQNSYFVKQLTGQKYATDEKYLAMSNRDRMKAHLAHQRDGGKAAALATTTELVRELQLEGLDLALKLDQICAELGLTYYLAEGTLLGAIRHQGFIPWDDDMDLVMPRADYIRLIEYLSSGPKDGLRLLHESVYPHYHLTFAKVVSVNPSKFITTHIDMPEDLIGPAVDIFPLDVASTKRDLRLERRIRRMRDMLLFKVGYMSKKTIKAKYKIYLASKVAGFDHLQRTITKLYRREEGQPDADQLVNYASSYAVDKEKVPAEAYGEPLRVPFEGHLLPVPADWDQVLSTTYGSYMELPPVNQRKPRHRPKVRADRNTALPTD